jgi:PAS domain S-box-containing protein
LRWVWHSHQICRVVLDYDLSSEAVSPRAMRLSEAMHRCLFEEAADGIIIADAVSSRLLEVNGRAEELTGYKRAELLAMSISDLIAAESLAEQRLRWGVLREDRVIFAERLIRRKDGSVFLGELSGRKLSDGKVVGLLRDLSPRKQLEATNRHLSRLYSLLSHVNQAVIRSRERTDLFQTVCDVAVEHGGFRMAWIGLVDDETQRLVPVAHAGHEADYLSGVLVTVNDPQTGRGPAGIALREGKLAVCDDIAADEGMAVWREAALARGYRTVASVALRVQGRSVAALTVYGDRVGFFCEDERRLMQELGDDIGAALTFMEAQADRRRAESALRASEERLRSLLQNSMDGIAMYASHGEILYQSPALSRILGYAPSELTGANVYELIHPDDRDQMRADYALLLQREGASMQRDRRYRHRDGSYRWIESVATNLLHLPSVGALVDNFRDITERRRAEEERQQLVVELNHAQKLDSIGRLAGGVAHDFNNMLAVILGSVELALSDLRVPWQVQGFLREIRDAGQRSAELTRQLLTFARKLPAEPRVIEVNGAVEGALKLLRRLIGENVTLHWKPGTAIWPIEMDPTQLGQVLTNLTINARDAIHDVGVTTIETANCRVDAVYASQHANIVLGDYVKLSVTDTGAGMPSEVQAHIFEPFFTTKRPGSGTGLGLATVYGIVKQYGGFIQVQSKTGQGSTFDIYLPRHRADKAAAKRTSATRSSKPQNTATILVVEDEPQVLSLVTALLKNLGYGVLGAPTPKAAQELIQQRSKTNEPAPDLLLTDIVMPTMNGIELTRALRQHHPKLRAIFMSGYVADAKTNQTTDPTTILYKPFTLKALAEQVQAALNTKEQESQPS